MASKAAKELLRKQRNAQQKLNRAANKYVAELYNDLVQIQMQLKGKVILDFKKEIEEIKSDYKRTVTTTNIKAHRFIKASIKQTLIPKIKRFKSNVNFTIKISVLDPSVQAAVTRLESAHPGVTEALFAIGAKGENINSFVTQYYNLRRHKTPMYDEDFTRTFEEDYETLQNAALVLYNIVLPD